MLEGEHARLEPLTLAHAEQLFAAASHDSIWDYMPAPRPQEPADAEAWIRSALADQDRGYALPFAIVSRATGAAVGSTRYIDIQPANCSLEIGWTWITPRHQRTALNTECKYLLLRHAFDVLGAVRVQLKTDGRNVRSQRAMERIGAVREGVLRRHMLVWDGHVRDSAYYSVIDREWPAVRQRILALLDR